jgi:hypothetical protein
MYRNVPIRRLGQDDDDSGPPSIGSWVSTPVSISPLVLTGISLLGLAFVFSSARQAGRAAKRKAKAVRRALKA